MPLLTRYIPCVLCCAAQVREEVASVTDALCGTLQQGGPGPGAAAAWEASSIGHETGARAGSGSAYSSGGHGPVPGLPCSERAQAWALCVMAWVSPALPPCPASSPHVCMHLHVGINTTGWHHRARTYGAYMGGGGLLSWHHLIQQQQVSVRACVASPASLL